MSSDRDVRAAKIRELLETERDSVKENTRVFNQGRYDAVGDLDNYQTFRETARTIKEEAIANLDDLIDELTANVEQNGGHVYVAEDATDATDYISSLAEKQDADSVVKSKSMTSEEIDVNEALEGNDVAVHETDLGEFVLQVADEAPSHIVAPAIHKSRDEIAGLFNEYFEPEQPLETARELTDFAREELGKRIESADLGMTGANFLVAETGTLVLVTSEGNARKCAVGPDTHVAVAGIEKIIPTVEQLRPFVELIGRSGTGQDITAYVSLLTPPVDSPNVDFADPDSEFRESDREFHLVLLDNGRREMREDDDLRETLHCIRCGACSNVCANFQHVGGHAFGGETYSGGIATGWEAGVHGLDSAAEFNDLCTGCSRCVPACPVKIDIPWINTVVRDRINRGADPSAFDHLVDGLVPDVESAGTDLGKRFFSNVDTVAKIGSTTAPVSNWLSNSSVVRTAMQRLLGVDRRRDLPVFADETLVTWFQNRGGARISPEKAAHSVVLYPDLYSNYVHPDRGKAAVRVLEAVDVHVQIPAIGESGRAPLSQGMIETARVRASAVADSLSEHIDADREVVVIEPSDLAMFRMDYRHLLSDSVAERLADHSYELFEFLSGLDGPDAVAQLSSGSEVVDYHSHCQQRSLNLEQYTVEVLSELGYTVSTTQAECCGMAGSFGFKTEYYDLSTAVGETLVEELGTHDRPLLTSGTSCRSQLADLTDRRPQHPVELIAPE
jgi:iron-sulfur cluster protein